MHLTLYTFQGEGFSLTDADLPVFDLARSGYLDEVSVSHMPRYHEARTKLAIVMGTADVIWCATDDQLHCPYPMPPQALWRLRVPAEHPDMTFICEDRWNRLIREERTWRESVRNGGRQRHPLGRREVLGESEEECWQRLFLSEPAGAQVLLRRPIPAEWVDAPGPVHLLPRDLHLGARPASPCSVAGRALSGQTAGNSRGVLLP